MSDGESITVCVRIRPDFENDGTRDAVLADPASTNTLFVPCIPEKGMLTEESFTFDHIMDSSVSQQEAFARTAEPLLAHVLRGVNATVIMYGQTGSGKTHSMIGGASEEDRGIIPRAAATLFDQLHALSSACTTDDTSSELSSSHALDAQLRAAASHIVSVSMLEVYNEEIRDLLYSISSCDDGDTLPGDADSVDDGALDSRRSSVSTAYSSAMTVVSHASSAALLRSKSRASLRPTSLRIVDSAHASSASISSSHTRGVHVEGAVCAPVLCVEDVMRLLTVANHNRVVARTACNAHSSRSHMMVILHVSHTDAAGDTRTGKLTLVDLAGSEMVGKSAVTGLRLDEAKHINTSLTHIGIVIHALTTGSKHIPYRNSVLTRLLSESLGGSARTCIVLTVSPHVKDVSESKSTLRFGTRAKCVTNRPVTHVTHGDRGGDASEAVHRLKALVCALIRVCGRARAHAIAHTLTPHTARILSHACEDAEETADDGTSTPARGVAGRASITSTASSLAFSPRGHARTPAAAHAAATPARGAGRMNTPARSRISGLASPPLTAKRAPLPAAAEHKDVMLVADAVASVTAPTRPLTVDAGVSPMPHAHVCLAAGIVDDASPSARPPRTVHVHSPVDESESVKGWDSGHSQDASIGMARDLQLTRTLLKDADDHVASMHEKLDALQRANEQLSVQLQERDAALESASINVQAATAAATAVEVKYTEAMAIIAERDASIAYRDETIAELSTQLALLQSTLTVEREAHAATLAERTRDAERACMELRQDAAAAAASSRRNLLQTSARAHIITLAHNELLQRLSTLQAEAAEARDAAADARARADGLQVEIARVTAAAATDAAAIREAGEFALFQARAAAMCELELAITQARDAAEAVGARSLAASHAQHAAATTTLQMQHESMVARLREEHDAAVSAARADAAAQSAAAEALREELLAARSGEEEVTASLRLREAALLARVRTLDLAEGALVEQMQQQCATHADQLHQAHSMYTSCKEDVSVLHVAVADRDAALAHLQMKLQAREAEFDASVTELRATHARELEKAREASEVQVATAMQDAAAQQHQSLQKAASAAAIALEQRDTKHQVEIAALMAAHDERMAAIVSAHTTSLDALEAAHAQQLLECESAYSAHIANVEAAAHERTELAREAATSALARVEAKHEAAMQSTHAEHAERMNAAAEAAQVALQQAAYVHEAEISKLRTEQEDASAAVALSHAAALNAASHRALAAEARLAEANVAHDAALSSLREVMELRIRTIQSSCDSQLAQLEKDANQRFNESEARAAAAQASAVAELTAEHHQALHALQQSSNAQLDDLKQQLHAQQCKHGEELLSVSTLHADKMEAAHARITELESSLQSSQDVCSALASQQQALNEQLREISDVTTAYDARIAVLQASTDSRIAATICECNERVAVIQAREKELTAAHESAMAVAAAAHHAALQARQDECNRLVAALEVQLRVLRDENMAAAKAAAVAQSEELAHAAARTVELTAALKSSQAARNALAQQLQQVQKQLQAVEEAATATSIAHEKALSIAHAAHAEHIASSRDAVAATERARECALAYAEDLLAHGHRETQASAPATPPRATAPVPATPMIPRRHFDADMNALLGKYISARERADSASEAAARARSTALADAEAFLARVGGHSHASLYRTQVQLSEAKRVCASLTTTLARETAARTDMEAQLQACRDAAAAERTRVRALEDELARFRGAEAPVARALATALNRVNVVGAAGDVSAAKSVARMRAEAAGASVRTPVHTSTLRARTRALAQAHDENSRHAVDTGKAAAASGAEAAGHDAWSVVTVTDADGRVTAIKMPRV